MPKENLQVIAIQASGASLNPSGNHLRWTFPEHLGFPKNGFKIYRSDEINLKDWVTLRFPKKMNLSSTGLLQEGEAINDKDKQEWALVSSESGNIKPLGRYPDDLSFEQVTKKGVLQIHFVKPVIRIEITLDGINSPITLSAYSDNYLTDQSTRDNQGRIQVSASQITVVELPLSGFTTLSQIKVQWKNGVYDSSLWGDPIIHLPLATDEGQAIKRLGGSNEKLSNRYTSSVSDARDYYGKENRAKHLVDWVTELQSTSEPSEYSKKLTDDDESPVSELKLQSILLLSAIDPNIARMLSLYWVDQFSSANSPQQDQIYDYKVVGDWGNGTIVSGLALNIGGEDTPVSVDLSEPSSIQLNGINWNNNTPEGRVKLQFQWGMGSAHPKTQVTKPVCYDVKRTNITLKNLGADYLTKTHPVLVSQESEEGTPNHNQYIDQQVPIGGYVYSNKGLELYEYEYEIQGIDIFGQVSKPLIIPSLQMRSLLAPPPPIRLKGRLTQPGFPWRNIKDISKEEAHKSVFGDSASWLITGSDAPAALDLFFEFGYSQHQQAPDAETFTIYWRADSLTQTIPIQILSHEISGNDRKVKVQNNSKLADFSGGIITNVDPEFLKDNSLPASERKRIPIKIVENDETLIIDSNWDYSPGHKYWITSNPYSLIGWENIGVQIKVQPPLESQAKVQTSFVTRGIVFTPRTQANQTEIGSTRNQLPTNSYTLEVKEILLDIELLEPNILAGTTFEIGSVKGEILYSTTGISVSKDTTTEKKRSARIGFSADLATWADGTAAEVTIKMEGSSNSPSKYIYHVSLDGILDKEIPNLRGIHGLDFAKQTSGGEIVWRAKDSQETAVRHARVISNNGVQSNRTTFLIETTSPTVLEELNNEVCSYYAPYHVRLTIDVGSSAKLGMGRDIPITIEQAKREIYFSIQTQDTPQNYRNQRQNINYGPLSAPTQITAILPPSTVIPEAPIHWGQSFNDPKADYANPPTNEGTASVKIKWRYNGEITAPKGIRFEVSRALDTTIVMAARKAWQRGDLTNNFGFDSVSVSGQLSLRDNTSNEKKERYIVRRLSLTTQGIELLINKKTAGSRLVQTGASARIVKAKINISEKYIDLRVEVLRGNFQIGAEATLSLPPEKDGKLLWDTLKYDVETLQSLANSPIRPLSSLTLVDEAFGLVTSVPLSFHNNEYLGFRDELPGSGRNKYFYSVRTVDEAENRSPWSQVSHPIYQVDLSPPEAPQILNMFTSGDELTLHIRRPKEDDITALGLYYHQDGEDQATSFVSEPDEIFYFHSNSPDQKQIQPLPLVKKFDVIDLSDIAGLPNDLDIADESGAGIFAIYKQSDTNEEINYLVDKKTEIKDRIISNINPVLSNDDEIVVILENDNQDTVIIENSLDKALPLKINNGKLDLSFPYTITEIIGVYFSWEFDFEAIPIELQASKNYATGTTSYDPATHSITGLAQDLEDKTPVIVLVRHLLASGSEEIILLEHQLGRKNSLVVNEGVINIDVLEGITNIIHIYTAKEFSRLRSGDKKKIVDYNLNTISSYLGKSLKGFNPLLSNYEKIQVKYRDGNNNYTNIDSLDKALFVTNRLPNNKKSKHFFSINFIKEIKYSIKPPIKIIKLHSVHNKKMVEKYGVDYE